MQYLIVNFFYYLKNLFCYYAIKIKLDIKPCPPNFIFPVINYAIKVFPHD